MSMPEFPIPNPDMTQEQALTMILSSIALEELALSHIINAEGEKIQYVLGNPVNGNCPANTSDILAVNKSVTTLLEMVMQNQLLLKNKMEKVLDHLPTPPCPPPHPPCPPPCPPCPPCSPKPSKPQCCFQAIPGFCKPGCALRWQEGDSLGRISVDSANCGRIHLPRTGWLLANVVLEIDRPSLAGIVCMELNITCAEKKPISKLFYHTASNCRPIFAGDVMLQMPCSCSPCYASLIVRSPDSIQLKQGYLSFTWV